LQKRPAKNCQNEGKNLPKTAKTGGKGLKNHGLPPEKVEKDGAFPTLLHEKGCIN
jgi:hypothetical protein